MKTTRYLLAALLLSVFAACTSEPAPSESVVYDLKAYIAPDGPQTRTILIDNPGVRVESFWTFGDAISLFTSSGENLTLFVDYENIGDSGKTALFHSYEGFPSGNLSALYPADKNAKVSGGKISTVFPDTQHYVMYLSQPEPDPAVSLMAGTGSAGGGVAFKNIMAVLKIGQSFDSETTVSAVTFSDLSGGAVSGTLSIDPSNNYASQVSGGNTVLTLDCGEGVEMEPGATGVFYMVVPAKAYPKGIRLSFITSEGDPVILEVGTEKGLTLSRGIIYPVGEISAREYIAGDDASILADNAHLMNSDVMRQVTVLDARTEYVINADGDYVIYGNERVEAPYYSILIPNKMAFKEGDYLVFEATDDLPSGGVFLITKKETPYADENHSRIEAHLTTDFAKAFKKLDYGAQLFDADGNRIEDAGEDIDLASYLSDVVDYQGYSIPYSITEDGQILISEDDFEEALTKSSVIKTNKSISSPKLSMTVTDPNKICEATVGARLTINMRAGLKVEDGELQWLHFNFNPQVKVSGNFSIKGPISKSKEFHLITLYFVPGIPVAPGVVLTPELEIRGSVGVGGEIVFSTSIEYTYDMGNFGFSYTCQQGFNFHHFESEPKPDDKFQPEMGASLTGTIYAQATLSAIPSISLCGIFRAGIYTDFTLKFAATTGGETINNNIYDTRKLSLVPELAFSPYVASLGGGNAEAFGIGQTLGVEVFDPESGTFDPLGILPGKRVLSCAVTFPDSSAVVSGNWYAPDDIVLYSPEEGFSVAKPVTEERSVPFMLPTSGGDVLIFSCIGNLGEQLEGWVDRLKGEPFLPPLFKEWAPLVHLSSPSDENALGGDAWLIPVFRRTDEQVAIAHVRGTDFSLLETDYPVPMTFPDGRPIDWDRLLVDRSQRKAYMAGFSFGAGLMVLVVDYNPALDGQAARLSLLYAPEEDGPFPYESHPVLLSPGRIAMVGGRMEDNFHPVSTVFVLNVGGPGNAPAKSGFGWWLLLLAACLIAALALWLFYSRRRAVMAPSAEPTRTDLLSRIISLMEERKLYLRKDLRIADVAAELGTNSTYVSACLNGQLGKSFNDFVSSYRVHYAQQLIQSHPQMPLDQVADESGFSSERSFYRIFKDVTGSSPGEWRTSPKNQFPR